MDRLYFPRQKVSSKEKTPTWFKKCVEAGISLALYNETASVRMSLRDKQLLLDLSNGIIDQQDIREFAEFNAYETDVKDIRITDYSITKPRLDLLTGEAAKRNVPYVVRAINMDAISRKENFLKEQFAQGLLNLANTENKAPEKQEVSDYVRRFYRYAKFEYQDARERSASHLLEAYKRALNVEEKLMLGFDDVTRVAEEIYCIEEIGGKPVLRKCDPRAIRVYGIGNSIYIDDADLIIEESYLPIGQTIDRYYDYLTNDQIKMIEEGKSVSGDPLDDDGILNTLPAFPSWYFDEDGELTESQSTDNGEWFGSFNAYDSGGNCHIVRVVWKGMRKYGEIKFWDETIKSYRTRIVDETYIENKELGESVEWFWVSEWYEATQIINKFVVKTITRPINGLKVDGYKSNGSGYVGTIYTIGNTKAQSLLGFLKPYEYLYSIIMRELKRAIKKHRPPMIEVDKSKIPDDFTLDEWLEYGEEMGYLIIDSMKEGTKGAALGKLAGQYNTTGKIYNPDMGNFINHLTLLLQFIEKNVSIISGVSDQRLGQIDNRETVGGIERSVTQSSNITEKLFKLHANTRIRVLNVLLETAISCHRKDKTKFQYITDELANVIFDLDGEDLSNDTYGIFVSNLEEDVQLLARLKEYTSKVAESQQMNIRDLFTIMTSNSMAEMRRVLEDSQEQAQQAAQQAAEQERQIEDNKIQVERLLKEKELAINETNNIRDNETAIQEAYISLIGKDKDNSLKLSVEQMKASLQERTLALEKERLMLETRLKNMELNEQERANKAKEVIDKIVAKRKPTTNAKK